jgi:energy-converting hydrogenase B subunit D
MIPLQIAALVLVGLAATCAVLVRDIVRQAMLSSVYALSLVVLFVIFQAPDVALSELVVGAIGFPLVVVVAIVKQRGG